MRLQLSVNVFVFFCFFFLAPSNKTSTRIFQGQGEQIISCDTYGVPQPIVLPNWWKNGMRLSVSRASSVLGNSHRLIINENNSLVIRQPRRDDKGAYSCETLQVYENSALKRQKLVFHVVVGKRLFQSISQGHVQQIVSVEYLFGVEGIACLRNSEDIVKRSSLFIPSEIANQTFVTLKKQPLLISEDQIIRLKPMQNTFDPPLTDTSRWRTFSHVFSYTQTLHFYPPISWHLS